MNRFVVLVFGLQIVAIVVWTAQLNHRSSRVSLASGSEQLSSLYDEILAAVTLSHNNNFNARSGNESEDYEEHRQHAQPQPTTKASIEWWEVPEEGVPGDVGCQDLMDHLYRRHDAYRGRSSTIDHTSFTHEPLVNYAWYHGQGFGRVVDHSTHHCILALVLNRPCAIDLEDRDPYHTWRSFIHRTSKYDWELPDPDDADGLDHPLWNYTEDIHKAFGTLKSRTDNEWKFEEGEKKPEFPNLHLVERPDSWPPNLKRDDFWEYLKPWRAENLDKIMLSPSWGVAWFPDLAFPTKIGKCPLPELKGLVQNALYKPTPLSLKLHRERAAKVLPMPRRPYGVIHVRTIILKEESRRRTKGRMTGEQSDAEVMADLLPNLSRCMKVVNATYYPRHIRQWWVLSDDAATAAFLAENMGKDYNMHHGYSREDIDNESPHSALERARGLFGHEYMSKSIEDWVTLHEAKLAVISVGSYGLTGSRGRGKFQRDKTFAGVDRGCDPFEILHGHDLDPPVVATS